MNLPEAYEDDLFDNVGLHAVWMPGSAIDVGDVLVNDHGYFQYIDELESRGVDFETENSSPIDIVFQSRFVRTVQMQAGVEVATLDESVQADASLEIHFRRERSFFVRATGCRGRSMKNPAAVARKIKEIPGTKWRHLKYYVVAQVYSPETFVVLANAERDAKVKFGGEASGIKSILQGKGSAGLEISGISEMSLSVLGDEGGPMAVKLFRVRLGGELVYV